MSAKSPARDWFNLFWVLNFFTALMAIIWVVSPRSPHTYSLLLVIILVSHVWHKDRLRDTGFWPEKIITGRFLGLISLALVLGGWSWILAGLNKPLTVRQMFLSLAVGSCWGLLQQYILNGFVINRLIGFFGNADDQWIPWIAAGLFSLAHAPNWFLMAVTFAGGYFCVKFFLKERNLYFLGLAHGFSGFLLLNFLPESLTHGFRIGQAYFR